MWNSKETYSASVRFLASGEHQLLAANLSDKKLDHLEVALFAGHVEARPTVLCALHIHKLPV